jgi:hypothetical protein
VSFNLNDYETVAQRVDRFQKLFLSGRIITEVISLDNVKGEILAKASVYREHEDEVPAATDYAFGVASTYNSQMRKFYVEDTITSAVGRALALVLEVKSKPTREDMSKVQVPVESDPWTVREVPQAQQISGAVETTGDYIVTAANAEIPTCKCGNPMKWGDGQRKSDGKPWGKYACATWNKSTGAGCDSVVWYEITASGTWAPQKGWSK